MVGTTLRLWRCPLRISLTPFEKRLTSPRSLNIHDHSVQLAFIGRKCHRKLDLERVFEESASRVLVELGLYLLDAAVLVSLSETVPLPIDLVEGSCLALR